MSIVIGVHSRADIVSERHDGVGILLLQKIHDAGGGAVKKRSIRVRMDLQSQLTIDINGEATRAVHGFNELHIAGCGTQIQLVHGPPVRTVVRPRNGNFTGAEVICNAGKVRSLVGAADLGNTDDRALRVGFFRNHDGRHLGVPVRQVRGGCTERCQINDLVSDNRLGGVVDAVPDICRRDDLCIVGVADLERLIDRGDLRGSQRTSEYRHRFGREDVILREARDSGIIICVGTDIAGSKILRSASHVKTGNGRGKHAVDIHLLAIAVKHDRKEGHAGHGDLGRRNRDGIAELGRDHTGSDIINHTGIPEFSVRRKLSHTDLSGRRGDVDGLADRPSAHFGNSGHFCHSGLAGIYIESVRQCFLPLCHDGD